jgi:hypothetical protein
MPDITMCNGRSLAGGDTPVELCPMRNSCYRYTTSPSSERQSYFVYAPFIKEPDGTSCEYFWKELD